MLKKRYISLAVLFIIILLLFTGVFRFGTEKGQDPNVSTESPTISYDSYALDVNTVIYNEEGAIDYTLQARRQVHYVNEITVLERPYLQLNRPSSPSWHLVADSGRILPSGGPSGTGSPSGQPVDTEAGARPLDGETERIELSGNVELYQSTTTDARNRLLTTFLTLYPTEEQLETEQPVMLNMDGLEQSARGMSADLREERLVFHAEVRGSYVPQR